MFGKKKLGKRYFKIRNFLLKCFFEKVKKKINK